VHATDKICVFSKTLKRWRGFPPAGKNMVSGQDLMNTNPVIQKDRPQFLDVENPQ